MAHSAFFVILGLTLNPTAIFALLIDPRSPSPVPPAVPNLPSNATTSGNFKVECDGNKYGRDLKPDSCAEVQNQIPTTSQPLRFGPRGRQGVDLATPWRWISSDGLCAIEVAETSAAQGSYLDLATAADEMAQICIDFAPHPEGSIASNIGVDGKLTLAMMSYRPKVTCRRPIILSDQRSRDEILRRMPATSDRLKFGRRGVRGVRVKLPLMFSSIDLTLKRKLVATVDVTTSLQETASWYDIWAATVAITGMCVRDGKGGSSSSLGDNGKIAVSVTEVGI